VAVSRTASAACSSADSARTCAAIARSRALMTRSRASRDIECVPADSRSISASVPDRASEPHSAICSRRLCMKLS
jgi:hypothetical protein